MTDKAKILGTEEAWDSEALGADEKHARRVDQSTEKQINDALGLQMISIRLDKSLIETFKLIGSFHGVGYQPLMRDALKRFAEGEMRAIVTGVVESQHKTSERKKPTEKSAEKPVEKPALSKTRKVA